jgi:2-polyprenyl-3-methyl-5-hydroxy-6-metoxy-1,4-benzoquinol methylase
MTIDRVRKKFDLNSPTERHEYSHALIKVKEAMDLWQPKTYEESKRIYDLLSRYHFDQHAPKDFWLSASSKAFRDFFVWGHNHDLGHGFFRSGAMGNRHLEITAELISLGMMPINLNGQKVLDIGCWSGGDLLVLAGLGAEVVAIEEHPLAAQAAKDLINLVGCDSPIHSFSAYNDKPDWKQSFDMVYCSGVIYHVTDPLLLLRICFAYLKPGGRLIIETKMLEGVGAACSYSGVVERGWNWYAPTMEAMGRWLVDAGFAQEQILVHRRSLGRILASGVKVNAVSMEETAGFSRPGSWLEGAV